MNNSSFWESNWIVFRIEDLFICRMKFPGWYWNVCMGNDRRLHVFCRWRMMLRRKMIHRNKERKWNGKLQTWRETLKKYGEVCDAQCATLCVLVSVVNNTRWGWLFCIFLIFILMSQFECLLLCSAKNWVFASHFIDSLHYILLKAGITNR
jgi:hypothetical protein